MRKIGRVLALSLEGYVHNVERGPRPQLAEGVKEQLKGLLSMAESYNSEMEQQARNIELSAEGQAKAAERAAQTVMLKLADFEQRNVTKVRERASALASDMARKGEPVRPTDPADRITYEMRQREIRDELRRLRPFEREHAYLTATDPEVIDAIENAPPVLMKYGPSASPVLRPFVDPETRSAAVLARARAKNPEAAAEVEALEGVASAYSIAVGTIREELLVEVPAARPKGAIRFTA